MQAKLNIYVCSTVRHLLFSLLHAAAGDEENHHILFFSDYQDASLAGWDLNQLPENIFIYELTRKDFRRQFETTLRGRLYYFAAMRNLSVPAAVLKSLHAILKVSAPSLAKQLAADTHPKVRLWLFNERNRMARLFKLLTRSFSLLEDGEGNYLLQNCLWWKWPERLLRGLPVRTRVFGESTDCDLIWVLHPDKLPQYVRHKGRLIDFLDRPSSRALIAEVFGDRAVLPADTGQIIVATQPFGIPGVNDADKRWVYGKIVDYIVAQGRPVVLKAHPAEGVSEYDFLGDRVTRAPVKIPLEVMLLGSAQPSIILSVLSTAGMGFERYCRRVKLCEDSPDDAEYFKTVQGWVAEPHKLDEVLRQKMPA